MKKINRSVVRNQAYQKKEFSIRERHNERKNENYLNSDIQPDRKHMNVFFKQCEGSYAEKFESLLNDGTISTRGLKKDAKVFDEMVFDVNTEYFDHNGGYEYAKSFFEEAYRLAVNEIGGEQYVLSAVMHADERNKALSEQHGRDIYHYHLHVVYVPVVDKEVLWTKRCKDPELVGKVKEVIKQVSHSKKWPRFKTENGWVNSYSLLQDRFYGHMKEAEFTGFERGERGSTAEHLSVLEYKTQQEAERAAALQRKSEKKEKQLVSLEKKTAKAKQQALSFADIDRMSDKRTLFGDIPLSPEDWNRISGFAKKGVKSQFFISELKKKISELVERLEKYEGKGITDTIAYYQARERSPQRMKEVIADIMRKPPEHKHKNQKIEHTDAKSKGDLNI